MLPHLATITTGSITCLVGYPCHVNLHLPLLLSLGELTAARAS